MAKKDTGASATRQSESEKAAGRKWATDALRKEAEREWVESDLRTAKGQRVTQKRAKRRGAAREREAEINRLKGEVAKLKRGGRRKSR